MILAPSSPPHHTGRAEASAQTPRSSARSRPSRGAHDPARAVHWHLHPSRVRSHAVHWHLGAEHYSAGQYDGGGKGPAQTNSSSSSSSSMSGRRELAGDYAEVRRGFRCHHYNEDDAKFNTD
eukprot:6607069-Prymnesium_polylepis.1